MSIELVSDDTIPPAFDSITIDVGAEPEVLDIFLCPDYNIGAYLWLDVDILRIGLLGGESAHWSPEQFSLAVMKGSRILANLLSTVNRYAVNTYIGKVGDKGFRFSDSVPEEILVHEVNVLGKEVGQTYFNYTVHESNEKSYHISEATVYIEKCFDR